LYSLIISFNKAQSIPTRLNIMSANSGMYESTSLNFIEIENTMVINESHTGNWEINADSKLTSKD